MLWLSLALLLVAAPVIPQGLSRLDGGGWDAPNSESARLQAALEEDFGEHGSTIVIVFSSNTLPATDPAVQDEITRALAPLRDRSEVLSIAGYATTGSSQFISRDGKKTYVVITVDAESVAEAERYLHDYRSLIVTPNLTQTYGGWVAASEAFNSLVSRDLRVQELVSLPLTLIVLVLVFGSLVAAGLPLAVGLVSIPAALGGIALMALLTDASIYVLNIATMLGLAVAIDYSLFLVTRFREELTHHPIDAALAATLATTGKAVFVSGITVAIGLSGMAFFPTYALRSMGLARAIVVGLAVFYALTLLPAALAMLGPKVNRLQVRRVSPLAGQDAGVWHWLATGVMRRPVLVLLPVLAALVVAGAPFLGARFDSPGMDMLPRSEESRIAYEALTYEFAETQLAPVLVVARPASGAMTDPANLAALRRVIDAIAVLPGVEQVQSVYDLAPAGRDTPPAEVARLLGGADPATAALARSYLSERGARLTVIAPGEQYSDALKRLVRDIRALDEDGTLDFHLLVGGATAYDLDLVHTIVFRLPYAIGFIMVVTYVVLFLLLGSVVLPLKAIAMNVLSITASFGALIWIFQDGHLKGLFGFEPTGYIVTTVPVMIVLYPVRVVDGLRGPDALPGQGGVRADRGQHPGGGTRPGADGPDDHQRGGDHDRAVRRGGVCQVPAVRVARDRDGHRGAGGRHHRSGLARAGHHAADGAAELVGAAAAAPPAAAARARRRTARAARP